MSTWDIDMWPTPPGQERRYPSPTKTGVAYFRLPSTGEVVETAYEVWGDLDPKSIPLICLHGGPGISHSYLLPISLIHADYGIPIVMYDQLGSGKSTRLRDWRGRADFWTPELFLAELESLVESLGIQHYDLLGHSWGGMLASQHAVSQPAGLRKLVLCDTPSDMESFVAATRNLRAQLPADVLATLEACERAGETEDSPAYQAALIEFNRRHLCRADPFPRELMATFAGMAEDSTVFSTMHGPTGGGNGGSAFSVTGSLAGWTIVDALASITEETVPGGVLLVNGQFDEAQDECVLPFFTRVGARVKWVQFALSAHMPWLEETEKFMRVVGAFLTVHCPV